MTYPVWEEITRHTFRPVEGGWLFRFEGPNNLAMVFVPEAVAYEYVNADIKLNIPPNWLDEKDAA